MTQLQLFLFGSPRLERDGMTVTVDTRKAIALLSYLALTSQLHSRDTLATLFWPEYAQSQARANLRRTLSALAKAIGKDLLEIDRENIGLVSSADLWVDACRFQQLRTEASSHNHPTEKICPICQPLLTEALGLYQADFMTGLNLSDSPNFEEWQFFQSESLRRELAWVLDKLICGYSIRGEFEAAIDAAWRRVALDPLDELAQRQLMQLYAWAGQRSAALRQYQNLVRLLDEELGVPPSEETETLHRAIVENQLSPPVLDPQNSSELFDKDNGVERQKPPAAAELSQETPEPKSKDQNPAHNLPAQTKPFIGREAELGALSEMLVDPNCRLLTLVGPGGVGKTRLAIEVACRQLEHFSDGVYFVSLAPLSGPDFVAPTIANALGLSLHGSGSLSQHLIHFLKEKQVLLVLDDIEQLLASHHLNASQSAAPAEQKDNSFMLLSDLLQAAPQLKLLVTSRERLRLQGEWVFEIHGLPLPPLEPTQGFEGYSAVNLFVQNARRVQHDFSLTSLERPAVARICQLVDGLPLGIELAAAWTHLLSCEEIAQEIERNLDFLATTDRDVPPRQRSLRAVFEYSWNLLTAEEQQVLSRLSVFRGGFTREAAQQIAGATLTVLSALVEKSLVYRLKAGLYTLHELVRQFSASYLADYAQELDATYQRHCTYYTTLLQQNQPLLRSQQQTATLQTLALELDNLRAAWDWAVNQPDVAQLNHAAEGLAIFYDLYGRLQEGAAAFDRAATILSNVNDRNPTPDSKFAFGRVVMEQGWFAMRRGQLERSQNLLEQSLVRLEPTGPTPTLAEALLILGLVARQRGAFIEANTWLNRSLTMCQTVNFVWGQAVSLYALGVVAYVQGHLDEAGGYLNESLGLCQTIGDPRITTLCLNAASAIPYALGRYKEAEQLLQQSISLHNGKSDRFSLGTTIYHLGVLCYSRGDYAEAQTFLDESLTLFKEIGDYANIVRALNSLGKLTFAQADYATTRRYYYQALQLGLQGQFFPTVLDVLAGVAELLVVAQCPENALEIAAFLLQQPASSKDAHNRASLLLSGLSPQSELEQVAMDCPPGKSVDELTDKALGWLSTTAYEYFSNNYS